MDSSERAKRMRRNSEFSNRLTTLHWAHQVLMDLKKTAISDVPSGVSMLGMGSSHRMLGVKSGFLPLEFTILSRSYRTSKHRLILLDWGGTLVAEDDKVDKLQAYALAQGHATRVGPSSQLKSVLESLCADPRNTVFLVSGKTIDAVNAYFGQVKGLGLAAEHGSFVRMPSKGGQVSQWVSTINVTDETWKEPAKLLMDNYSVRTHGTYVEQKGNAMIWQFRDADLEFGYAQSKELEDNLREILSGYPVEVLRGGGVSDGYIEVRPIGVSKGHFLMHIQEKLKSIRFAVDFIMAVGDDNSDEPMFEAMEQMPKSEHLSKFAVAVGMRPNTAATSYVDDPGQVMECLTMLAKCSSQQNERRYHSVADLQSQVRPQSNVTSFSPSFAPLKGSSGFGRMYRGLSMSDLSSAPIEVVEVLHMHVLLLTTY
jgi:trehalose 6-phosphate synthase/phosphatase